MTKSQDQKFFELCQAYRGTPIHKFNQTMDAFNALRQFVVKLSDDCKHPKCACVCGHQGRCPEDGATAGLST